MWALSKIESFARMLRLPRFILLDILSVLMGLIIAPVGTIGPFLLKDNHFKTVKELVDYVKD